ncbi:hypothetical protein KP509_05G024200 [Ceratopteris richardii]|uniref:Translocon-associated protein subunit alpha n=1 Tax=Ceratopteris richardii TaxID=49495 RepID=A0A8T2URV7_CERRI|nr:hypothetical protein KP509_05G024200 [Ceratopteris richardii]KAH7436524.1 hypothetical protein KP509_05G024200 [Ceratopteris richardii]
MARSAFFIALLLVFSSIASIGAQDDSNDEAVVATENPQGVFEDSDAQPAPGVDTVVYFPNNPDKSIRAGEKTEILVGISNHGDSDLHVNTVKGSLHVSYDHRYKVQDFYSMNFENATVPKSVQASFPYSLTVSKYLQPGSFDLVATILYEVDEVPYQSVFYNGSVEVAEADGFVRGETLFLVMLGGGVIVLFGVWVSSRFQKLSKKTRKTKKVESGTRGVDTVDNEWLQGTAFTQKLTRSISQPTKSKKKK